ncbi:MAG: hypothetical protein ABRQ38_26085, partial [Candidatus Eremiobacterota bacterium]
MAKKSWTKSLKALFGKGSDDSEADQEEKKKKEVWEKEDDDGVVWAYFPVHEEKEEEKKSSVIEEDVVSDDILLESEEDIPSREEALKEEEKYEEKTRIVEENYLDDEIIYSKHEESSKKESIKITDKTNQEKIALEEEEINKIISPSEEFIQSLKIAYIKHIKHKYPFKDFSYLDKELKSDTEETADEEHDESPEPSSPFEKVFTEMQEHITGETDEPKTEGRTEKDDRWDENYGQFSFSSENVFAKKETGEEKTSSSETKSLWGEGKYDDFFSSSEAIEDKTLSDTGDLSEDTSDKSKKKRNRFADIVSSVNQEKIPVAADTAIALGPVETKVTDMELTEEDKLLNPDELIEKGDKELELGWKDKAIKHFKKAALLYKYNDEPGKAFLIYQKLNKFDPANINYIYALGFLCKNLGRIEEAKIHFRNVLKIELTHKDTLFQLGIISYEEGALDTALIAFRKVLSLDPCHIEAYEKLSELLIKKGDVKEAINNYLKGAQQFLNKKEEPSSIKLFKKILSLEADNEEARKGLKNIGLDPDLEMAEEPGEEVSEEILQRPSEESYFEELGPDETIEYISETLETQEIVESHEEDKILYEEGEIEQKEEEIPEETVQEEIPEKTVQEEIPEETREKEEILDEETEEDNISNNIKEKGFYKTMNLDVKFEANLDDFIEEISPEYTLEPSLQKILNRHMEEFSIPSVEDIIYTSAEIIFSSFMEDFIDDFDTVNMTADYKIDDSLYTKFSNMINKTDIETIEELKNRAREFRMGTKISAETEIIEDLTLPSVVPEIKEVKVSEKPEEIEIKTPTSETDIPGIIYESLSEEFVEDFIKGELKPYDEEEAMGIGLGIEMEEEEELEEEETITYEETLEKETEVSEMETREIEVKESDLEKIEERLEKILAEKAEEVKTEKTEEVKTEKAEEVKTEKTEEVKTEKAEEVKTEKAEEVKTEK